MNLQIEVPDVDELHAQALRAMPPSIFRLRSAGIDGATKKRAFGSSSSSTQTAISFVSSRALANGNLYETAATQ